MSGDNNNQPPAAWRYGGDQLKRWRTQADVTQERLASAANYSPETIASMERGVRMPTSRVLDVADELCGAQGMLSAAKQFLNRERFPARAQDFMEREKEAISLWWYEVTLVPGLLQTQAYARALIDNRIPPLDEETVEERVAARMERQVILTDRKPPVGLSFVRSTRTPAGLIAVYRRRRHRRRREERHVRAARQHARGVHHGRALGRHRRHRGVPGLRRPGVRG
ncbi:Scr1 family TA system antitoxin-like transcriptional regulator [Streptomyces sp. NPDC051985]|uniref:Scr1 family TA system antitoxin-like transcriptional regulator n=1 Tax=Streptomyces sp. NPDC051985 TaxID=3155807 RepID=UPI003430CF08